MSYFEDQMEAWEDNNCQGDPTEYNPDEYFVDKFTACEAKGHGEIRVEKIEKEDGSFKKGKVCQNCRVLL